MGAGNQTNWRYSMLLLLRTDSNVGERNTDRSIAESSCGRESLWKPGGPTEPVVPVETLIRAISQEEVESFRPLLPVGYNEVSEAYKKALDDVSAEQLTEHYTEGLGWFKDTFTPYVKGTLADLSNNEWGLSDYDSFAAGSDVDFMTHIVNSVSVTKKIALYPGDWYGFLVGGSFQKNIEFSVDSKGKMACLCVPSVRNGQLSGEMYEFLDAADSCLLNINLYPTMSADERIKIAQSLKPFLKKSIISISFSRGFGLTASQLGVILVHPDHPLRAKYDQQWNWFTYFYNFVAAKAFTHIDISELQKVDEKRRQWVNNWLDENNLPVIDSGTYYVKSFRVKGKIPEYLQSLCRRDLLRLCFKPQIF